jgi:hypothetical protein
MPNQRPRADLDVFLDTIFSTSELEDNINQHFKWKMNSTDLLEAKPELKRLWESQPPQAPFFSKICKLVCFYKLLCRNKAKSRRAHDNQIWAQLQAAIHKLQCQLHDTGVQDRHGSLKSQVQELEDYKVAGKRLRNCDRWMLKGNSFSKEFFSAVREQPEIAQ